jgi:alkanesulfonate monooxygenase
MSIELNWYLPSHGDHHGLTNNRLGSNRIPVRESTPAYLAQAARAMEYAGFHAILIPTGSTCHDAWIAAAALSRATTTLKFLVAFRPGFVLPAVAAQIAQSLQKISGNRLLLNVVTGGNADEQQGYGDFLDHDQRYERTGEFLDIVRQFWAGKGVNFEGRHYKIRDGGLAKPLQQPPALYFGGASPAAEAVAAQFSDTYLLWGEPPGMVRDRIERTSELAARHGRKLQYGYRVHVISRDTEDEAWAEADRLLREVPKQDIERAQRNLRASQSVGQARMMSLHAGKTFDNVRDLEIYPNLWAGVGLVRGGAGTAFVGSHRQVAERIEEFHALGLQNFILSGYPNLEESLRVGEEVLPLLSSRPALRAVAAH